MSYGKTKQKVSSILERILIKKKLTDHFNGEG